MIKVKRWEPNMNFNKLSHLSGALRQLIKEWKLKNGEAVVVTNMGWTRLRLIARLGDRAVMLLPDTPRGVAPLEVLMQWVALNVRDGVVALNEWRALQEKAA